ncbi:hypothetical protein HYPSUDRAFT_44697 [Hypholoma sublateritium FD-334 SS-4]|uniref:F-box domain-containing protein n=1 Tax=Hypholoma sublateritium (strain FD-334 SS-4) TaxID=945553 RepID=A0A0D2NJF8_HYPSF|nr:hypothetical protein HYPSUDRAFT_44697 [Hypholoma sublateritium FD-334 SS-4]
MGHAELSSKSVLEALLKTNRPPTDQETAIIRESMALINAKLKGVEAHISEMIAHIQELKAQVEQAETKLRCLREEEASILETLADHRRIFSPFRNLPDDVLLDIFAACVEGEIPTLSFHVTPLPYTLAQISRGIRRIVLATPSIWASINIRTDFSSIDEVSADIKPYSILAAKAIEWLERAGGMSLTVYMQDPSFPCLSLLDPERSDPSCILFDTLLLYSARWKHIQFESTCIVRTLSAPLLRISALMAADVPLLESISLRFQSGASAFRNSPLLLIPTLKRLELNTNWADVSNPHCVVVSEFTVSWAILTSITIHADSYFHVSSVGAIAMILRQTKCLVFCDIAVGPGQGESQGEISLPWLKVLRLAEGMFAVTPSGAASILDLINAPILATLILPEPSLKISVSKFLKRTPNVQELSLSHFRTEGALTDISELLRHCPSLSVLSLRAAPWPTAESSFDGNRFLRAFVDDDGAGVTCPHLQYFECAGKITFTLQTLRQFLQAKHRAGIPPPNCLSPWKRVAIDMSGISELETHQQMLDLVSQEQAMGLDIYAHVKD